jgi:hypothetical protein
MYTGESITAEIPKSHWLRDYIVDNYFYEVTDHVKKTLWMKAKKIPDYVLFVYVVLNMII